MRTIYLITASNGGRNFDVLGATITERDAEQYISECKIEGRNYREYYYEPVQLIGEQDDVAIQN